MSLDWSRIDGNDPGWKHRSACGCAIAVGKAMEQIKAQIAQVTDPEARNALESIAELLPILAGAGENASREASHAAAYASDMNRGRW